MKLTEYYKRVRKIWSSELPGFNKFISHNVFAAPPCPWKGQLMKLIVLIKKWEKFPLWPVIFIKTAILIVFLCQENSAVDVLKK